MSSHASQKEAKKALRSEIKSRLSQLSTQDLTSQSEKAQNIVLNSPQYKNALRVGIYLSMPQSEAQTDLLIRDALSSSQAKKVFVPYIYSVKNDDETSKKRTTKVMDMMRLETMEEYAGLEKDGWGIPKLSEDGIEQRENAMGWEGLSLKADGSQVENESDAAVEGGLDLIVVPAVAFDRKLNRLGHGAGFYDKFLTRNFGDGKAKKPYLFGLCLAEQIVPEGKLVMESWDWRVDAVAVGDGTLLIFVPDRVPLSNPMDLFSLQIFFSQFAKRCRVILSAFLLSFGAWLCCAECTRTLRKRTHSFSVNVFP